jgi:hypothetical protein
MGHNTLNIPYMAAVSVGCEHGKRSRAVCLWDRDVSITAATGLVLLTVSVHFHLSRHEESKHC